MDESLLYVTTAQKLATLLKSFLESVYLLKGYPHHNEVIEIEATAPCNWNWAPLSMTNTYSVSQSSYTVDVHMDVF
jgi:hypothetical protein